MPAICMRLELRLTRRNASSKVQLLRARKRLVWFVVPPSVLCSMFDAALSGATHHLPSASAQPITETITETIYRDLPCAKQQAQAWPGSEEEVSETRSTRTEITRRNRANKLATVDSYHSSRRIAISHTQQPASPHHLRPCPTSLRRSTMCHQLHRSRHRHRLET